MAPSSGFCQSLDAVLAGISSDNTVRQQGGAIWAYVDRGLLVWKFAAHTCFQSSVSARLDELDLHRASVEVNPDARGTSFLRIPCKRAGCAKSEYGTHVWSVLGYCPLPVRITNGQNASFVSSAFNGVFARDLVVALRH